VKTDCIMLGKTCSTMYMDSVMIQCDFKSKVCNY